MIPATDRPSGLLLTWLRYCLVFGGGLILLLVLWLLHITQGEAHISAKMVLEAIFSPQDSAEHHVVRTLRMSRATLGVITGAALAAAGVLLQTITRNPLSSASTLGINSGAFLAVTVGLIFFPTFLSNHALAVAFIGGIAALGLVYAMSGGRSASPVRLTLAGMAITMAIAAVTGALQLLYETETARLFLWGSGSLHTTDWSGVVFIAPWIAGAVVIALGLGKSLDLFQMGDEMAKGLGQRVGLVRVATLLTAVMLAATTVSVAGGIGFIGLIAPHLVRLFGIRRHLPLLIGSMIWGAAVLVGADVFTRMFRDAYGELPVGAVTAMIGAPWMIWLALRARSGGKPIQQSNETSLTSKMAGRLPYPLLVSLLSAGALAILIAGLALGGLRLPLAQVVDVLTGGGEPLSRNIMLNMRLPRMLIAACAGAALAISGVLLQGIVRNPMADPSIVGVTSGAGVGAVSLLILWPTVGISWIPVAAFAGAIVSAAVVYLAARRSGLQPALLALVGIAVSALGSAIIQLLVVKAQFRVGSALVWLAGSTYARTLPQLWPLLVWLIVLLPMAWSLHRKLDLLGLSDEASTGLGIRVPRTRLWAGVVGVALAAAAVATVGAVGFIGLIAPHAARLLVGHNHRRLLPVAAIMGALLLMGGDLVGRVVLSPKEIPSGLVVALLGAPYFIGLMRASQRGK